MRIKYVIIFCLIVLPSFLYGQYMPDKEAESALELFNNGEFSEAYKIFQKKLRVYSKDPYINYYAGISLWKSDGSPDEVIALLKNVLGNVGNPELYYALSENYFIKQDYEQALYYMERCLKVSGRKYAKENNLQEKLNEIQANLIHANEKISIEETQDTLNTITNIFNENDNLQHTTNIDSTTEFEDIPNNKKTEIINEEFLYDANQPENLSENNYAKNLALALKHQKHADIIKIEKDSLIALRINVDSTINKSELYKQIKLARTTNQTIQDSANFYFTRVIMFESEIQKDHIDKIKQNNTNNLIPAQKESVPKQKKTNKNEEFSVLSISPYSNDNPIPFRIENSNSLIYSIQMGVFSKPVAYNFFGGICPVSYEEIRNGQLFKYYAGNFSAYVSAYEALKIIRANGYKDAYIVAWFKGVNTSINRAKEIENELYQ